MIQIDIDADLMLVDDEDRFIGHLPADPSRLHVGGIAIAGRPGGYTWALVEDLTDIAVYIRNRRARGAQARWPRSRLFLTASVGPAAAAHPRITPTAHRTVPGGPGGPK